MRRKSARNATKSSEEVTTPTKKPDTPRKPTRTSKRRRRSVSKSGDESEEETSSVVDRLEPIEESNVEGKTAQAETEESQAENNQQDNHKEEANTKEDEHQQAEVNENTEEIQGKSKELSNSQTEQSPPSNNIEPDIENEHVQGTHQSPSKDIGDHDKNDSQEETADNVQPEEASKTEDNFESAYTQESGVQKEDDNSQCSVKSEERSLTPEVKERKKITLKRLTNEKHEGHASAEEESTTNEKEEKSVRKITLKRRITLNQDKTEAGKDEGTSEIAIAQVSSTVAENGTSRRASTCKEDEAKKQDSITGDQPQKVEVKCKPATRKIKLVRKFYSVEPQTENEEPTETKPRRRLSALGSSDWLEKISESMYKIDVETIKIVCPKLKFLKEEDVKLEMVPPRERIKSESGSSVRRKMSTEEGEIKEASDDQSDTSVMAHNRKISIVDLKEENADDVKSPPSPAKNPVSEVLFITNLVRPFTLKQLRELLERTGTIEKDGFWTDRIKSKCYVRYTNTEDAETTRNSLHNEFWPVGNGKKLNVEFSTFEEMDKVMNPPVVVIPDPLPEKENREPEQHAKHKIEREVEKPPRKREAPVREWDIGKEEHRRRSRTRTPSKERVRKHSRRSYTPEVHKKKAKKEEPVPQKLMDDLFLKTKATPSIYWQPLSPEEIAKKVHQRLVRMEEHKRRIEETRDRARDGRRNQYRRR